MPSGPVAMKLACSPPILKCQFGDAGLVQVAQTVGHHEVVLLFGRSGQREHEALRFAELKGDAGVLGTSDGVDEAVAIDIAECE